MNSRPAPETPGAVRWQWSRFPGLSGTDVYEILSLRQRVFVVEQDCVYPDADGRDTDAWHLVGRGVFAAGGGNPIAYARVFEPGVRYQEVSIGRIVTAPEVRGRGLGRLVVTEAIRRCAQLWPGEPIRIAAQRRLEKFYLGFGFVVDGEAYFEDGIEHVDMVMGTANGRGPAGC